MPWPHHAHPRGLAASDPASWRETKASCSPAPAPLPFWAQIYKEQLSTRIVLVAMETWADGDKIQVQDDLLETLARLMVYRQEGLPEPSDATHLFS